MATNEEKLKRLFSLMEEDSLTKEDFVKAFADVVKLVKKVESQLLTRATELTEMIKKAESKLGDDNKSDLASVRKEVNKALEKALAEQANSLNFIRDKVRKITDGKDGSDGLDGKDGEDGKDGSPDTPDQIANKLESLPERKKLKISAIKGLEERLDKKVFGRGGGGITDIGVKAALGRMLTPETPSGAINGTNKAYTVSNTISNVIAFAINGQTIHPSEYTTSGKTITFTTALDASLSGTSFTIVYV